MIFAATRISQTDRQTAEPPQATDKHDPRATSARASTPSAPVVPQATNRHNPQATNRTNQPGEADNKAPRRRGSTTDRWARRTNQAATPPQATNRHDSQATHRTNQPGEAGHKAPRRRGSTTDRWARRTNQAATPPQATNRHDSQATNRTNQPGEASEAGGRASVAGYPRAGEAGGLRSPPWLNPLSSARKSAYPCPGAALRRRRV